MKPTLSVSNLLQVMNNIAGRLDGCIEKKYDIVLVIFFNMSIIFLELLF